ncbi:hypothetical protein PV379_03480 [Streptomyces caniscabiei]|uniref:hypothetical protein n=1 Tax=Streptomyces caniscabiei TaxID=2746961 RepID=UPI0029B0BE0F|nr:hypothetical protein [Streptomyces caniscabiei]MDX2776401.1 hypothetical protein [Streptomyces caniscabiei]
MSLKRGFLALVLACIALLASACGSGDGVTYRQYQVVLPKQKKAIEASADDGVRALLDKGYSPVALTYRAKRSGERVGAVRLVFAVCGKKALEECYLDVSPTTSRPLVTTVVTSQPNEIIESSGRFYLSYPYNDLDHRVCSDVEQSSTTPNASPSAGQKSFSIGITTSTVNSLEKIGQYFKGKSYSYGNPNQYTKEIGPVTWRCVLSAA